MSSLFRAGPGQVDAELVGLVFGRNALLAKPQMQYIEGTGSQTDRANASVLVRQDDSRILENSEMLHERGERHREGRRELGHDGRCLREAFDDRPTRRIREGTENGIDVRSILRHTPKCRLLRGLRQDLLRKT